MTLRQTTCLEMLQSQQTKSVTLKGEGSKVNVIVTLRSAKVVLKCPLTVTLKVCTVHMVQ